MSEMSVSGAMKAATESWRQYADPTKNPTERAMREMCDGFSRDDSPRVEQAIKSGGAEYGRDHRDAMARWCAVQGYGDQLHTCLQQGVDPALDNNGLICAAAASGDKGALRTLINHGADPNAQGGTPLLNAAANGHEQATAFLLKNGADPDASGGAALRTALERGHDGVCKALLRGGANPEVLGAMSEDERMKLSGLQADLDAEPKGPLAKMKALLQRTAERLGLTTATGLVADASMEGVQRPMEVAGDYQQSALRSLQDGLQGPVPSILDAQTSGGKFAFSSPAMAGQGADIQTSGPGRRDLQQWAGWAIQGSPALAMGPSAPIDASLTDAARKLTENLGLRHGDDVRGSLSTVAEGQRQAQLIRQEMQELGLDPTPGGRVV